MLIGNLPADASIMRFYAMSSPSEPMAAPQPERPKATAHDIRRFFPMKR